MPSAITMTMPAAEEMRPLHPPPSMWRAKCHPLEPEVSESVHKYFLAGWKFRSAKARAKFPLQGLATWHCYAFPEAKDDRIEASARLSVILFLVDDDLEHMSLKEGSALVERIISIVKGEIEPDLSVPTERMMKEVWDNLASIDQQLTDEMKEPATVFWRSQVAPERLQPQSLKSYLQYREADIASALLCGIQRFSMQHYIPAAQLALLDDIHKNYSDFITVVNDICSYDKEALTATASDAEEGAAICSAVQVLADETGLTPEMAKHVLWAMCREWERNHERLVRLRMEEEGGGVGEISWAPEMLDYLNGLRLQIRGTETWSLTCFRYHFMH